MADGLLFAYTDPGRVPLDEFHDWYDSEHGPARLTVPGITAGYRFRALDEAAPPWLAIYETQAGAVDSPEYQALAPSASAREKKVLSDLALLDRRVYEQVSSDGAELERPGPVLMIVSMSVPTAVEDDMAAWYAEEHIPMLLAAPGWQRIRRYRLCAGTAPAWLSLHDLASMDVFDTPEYKAAVSTPWRNRLVDSATARDKRVFGFHKSFG
jgi:hypothetical protein